VRAYDESLATDGRHFGSHYNLGTLHLIAGAADPARLRLATSHLQAATEINPGRVEAWLNLALVQERTNAADPEVAYAAAARAATGSPAMNRVRWQRAQWLDRRQPPQKVAMRDELRRILAEDPDFADANGMLGAYLYDIADFDGAITHLTREISSAEPADPSRLRLEAHFLLAVIYTDHRPDPVKALAHAQAYYKYRPDAAKIHELRRRALRLSGAMGNVPPALPDPTREGRAPAQPSHDTVHNATPAPAPTATPHGAAPAAPHANPAPVHH
jgi:tetratricopeptide (TPR) repeat protein